ncbi:hypothetical protein BCEN4_700031 [Burkholderia cenocepacia]|nr:hypothetical protein BCEN4_700031 [Burkholderia cenocepacia]
MVYYRHGPGRWSAVDMITESFFKKQILS